MANILFANLVASGKAWFDNLASNPAAILTAPPTSFVVGTAYTINGTYMDATAPTVSIGGVGQTITAQTSTSVTFTCQLGSQKYGSSKTVVYTRADGKSTSYGSATLSPASGYAAVDLVTLNLTVAFRLTSIPDLVNGDEIEYSTVGGKVTVGADGSFTTTDNTVGSFAFRVNDGTGWGASAVQTITLAALGPPASVTAVAASDSQINLAWPVSTQGGLGIAGYNVYRSGVKVNSALVISLAYADTGLTYATTYQYTIRTVDTGANESSDSPIASATTLSDTTAPTAPSSVLASAISVSRIDLSWTASTDAQSGVKGYLIFRNGVQVTANPVAAVSYSDTNLTPTTAYSYQLKAIDNVGNASVLSSPAASATTLSVATPAGLSISGIGTAGATATWNAVVGASAYRVRVNGIAITPDPTTAQALLSSLTASTSYAVTVATRDANGNESAQSGVVNFTTAALTVATPTGVAVTAITMNSATVTWTPVAGATKYRVYIGGIAITPDPTIATAGVTGLSPGTPYAITVAAIDAALNVSAQSVAVQFTSGVNLPVAPAGVSVSAITTSSAVVAWTNGSPGSAPLQDYIVSVNGVDRLPPLALTVFTYVITGLSANTPYSVTVRVRDTAGNAATASAALFSTLTPDTTPPNAPVLFLGTVSSSTVNLSWTASVDVGGSGIAGYNLYKDGVNTTTALSPATSAVVTGVNPGQSYVFQVTAVDGAGNESTQSNTIVVTTSGAPPVATTMALPVNRFGGGVRRATRPRRKV